MTTMTPQESPKPADLTSAADNAAQESPAAPALTRREARLRAAAMSTQALDTAAVIAAAEQEDRAEAARVPSAQTDPATPETPSELPESPVQADPVTPDTSSELPESPVQPEGGTATTGEAVSAAPAPAEESGQLSAPTPVEPEGKLAIPTAAWAPEPLSEGPSPVADAPQSSGRLSVPGENWVGISPRYMWAELITAFISLLVIVGASIAVVLIFDWSPVLIGWIGGALAAIQLIDIIITPRRVRSIRYLLRDDDLLFRKGIMWQRIVAVPYGRMQLIDINRGPIARMLGLSELKFVTASSASNITVPGLPEQQAVELRDHLVAVAESRRSGL